MNSYFIKKRITFSFIFLILLFLIFFTGSVYLGLAFAAFLGIFAVTSVTAFLARKNVNTELVLSATAEKKGNIDGRIIVRNNSVFPFLGGCAEILIRNNMTLEENRMFIPVFSLGKGETEIPFFLLSDKCGMVEAEMLSLSVSDIFGLLKINAENENSVKGKSTVLPQLFDMEIVFDNEAAVPVESEEYSKDRKGNDISEIFSLREYVPGDNIKNIHWKLSAKTDNTIVREASLPISHTTLLFFDKYTGNPDPKETDALAEAFLTTAERILNLGITYTIGTNGNSFVLKEIDSDEAFIESIPDLIKERPALDNLYDFNTDDFGRIIWFGKEIPDYDHLFSGKNASFVLCSGNDENAKIFNPDNYEEDLKTLELI